MFPREIHPHDKTLRTPAGRAIGLALGVVLVAALVWSLPTGVPEARAQEAVSFDASSSVRGELAARGAVTYRVYCRNCHGAAAEGDGRLAELLTVEPTDLTRIAADNDGVFPFDQVYKTIDGRRAVPAHGDREMPIWGTALSELGPDGEPVVDEDAVRGRILQLVYFLESIQER